MPCPPAIKQSKRYFLAFLLLWLAAFALQLFFSQEVLFMYINGWHNPFLDVFFLYITFLGDGLVALALIAGMLFVTYRQALIAAAVFLGTALVAQLLKHLVFAHRFRPLAVLKGTPGLHIPAGVEPLFNNSFPSGHTTTAFAMATFMVLARQGKGWAIWLLLAIIVGLSRVYLTHHFPADVLGGALLGTVGGGIIYLAVNKALPANWGRKSLLR